MMVGTSFCATRGLNELELAKMGECPLDPGGYFIINGSEKVNDPLLFESNVVVPSVDHKATCSG